MGLSPILILHVFAGSLGLLSGTVAICVRKGSRAHASAGIVFSVSMLTLAATGAWVAYLKSQMGNILGGVLTFYMVGTAWLTVRRRNVRTGALDWVVLLAALAIGAVCIKYAAAVVRGQVGTNDGVPAGMDFFLGSVVLIAAAGDLHVVVRGGISGVPRIARHLWRMCFGLFIASGSFFMGRQRIFPDFIRNSGILIFLTVFPLILLIFWLVRVRFKNGYIGQARLAASDDFSA